MDEEVADDVDDDDYQDDDYEEDFEGNEKQMIEDETYSDNWEN